MGSEPHAALSRAGDFAAYDRQSVEQFFRNAHAARRRLLEEIAETRDRIETAEAALARTGDDPRRTAESVVEAQRRLRDEARANVRVIETLAEYAEASAARILAAARTDAAAAFAGRGTSQTDQPERGAPGAAGARPRSTRPPVRDGYAAIADRR